MTTGTSTAAALAAAALLALAGCQAAPPGAPAPVDAPAAAAATAAGPADMAALMNGEKALLQGAGSSTNFWGLNFWWDPRPTQGQCPGNTTASSCGPPPEAYFKASVGAGKLEMPKTGTFEYVVPANTGLVINYVQATGTGDVTLHYGMGYFATSPGGKVPAGNPAIKLNGALVSPYNDAVMIGGASLLVPRPQKVREYKFGPAQKVTIEVQPLYGWTIAGYTIDLAEVESYAF